MSVLVDAFARCAVSSGRRASLKTCSKVKPGCVRASHRLPPRNAQLAAAKGPTRITQLRGARLVVRASEDEEDWEALFANLAPLAPTLPAYKTAILERALARGRRQVPIRDLAADLDLSREDVLDWLKANKKRQEELAQKYPVENEMIASVEIDPFDPSVRADGRDYDDLKDNRSVEERSGARNESDSDYDSQTAYLKNVNQQHVPKGMPAYKGYSKKRLGATNVATLEKVFHQDRFPDDSMVDAVHRATKLPRSKIVAWFKTRREDEKVLKRKAARGRFGRDRDDTDTDGFDFEDSSNRFSERERRGGRREGSGGGWKVGGVDKYGESKSKDTTSGWMGNGRR